MEGLIIFRGKYNSSRQYAEWLAADLQLTAEPCEEVLQQQLKGSDYLVIGSAVYFGKLLISHWLKENLLSIKSKKIFLFVVCGTPLSETEKLNGYVQASVPEEIRNRCEVFFLPGRMIRKQLSWWHRLVVGMVDSSAKNKDPKEKIPGDYDYVEKSRLEFILKSIRKFCNKQGSQLEKAAV